MSKKKLLEEAQIRRMFQLAGMPAIGEGFIGGKFSNLEEEEKEEEKDDIEEGGMKYKKEKDEDEVEEGMKYSREEEEGDAEMEAGDEEPADALGGEPEAEMGAEPAAEAGGDIPQDKVEAIVDAVLAGIEKETGVPLERVPEEGGAEEAPAEEPEMAMGGDEEGDDDMADLQEADEKAVIEKMINQKLQNAETLESYGMMDEAAAEREAANALKQKLKSLGESFSEATLDEVSRRVARRLIQLTKKNK